MSETIAPGKTTATSTHADWRRVTRRLAVIAWTACTLEIALLNVEDRLEILHPASLLFIALILLVFLPGLAAALVTLGTLLRRRARAGVAAWAALAMVPALLWSSLGYESYGWFRQREIPHNWRMRMAIIAGASLLEARAVYLSPHRLRTPRLVMFYDDAVTTPQADANALDEHVARMEALTGLPLRARIFLARGAMMGDRHVAFRGLAFGSEASPAGYVDLHELAHAILSQHERPDTDPPTMLAEGWAESQSHSSKDLAIAAIRMRRDVARWAAAWASWSEPQRREWLASLIDPDGLHRLIDMVNVGQARQAGYLRELSRPAWYHHDAGAVYWFGGAFVDHLLRRYGPGRFVQLYFACRPEPFDRDCARMLGAPDLETIEREFWQDEERVAGPAGESG